MGGLAAAWLVGEGIVCWREVRASGHMPVPGALLGVSALFLGLSLVADAAPRARGVVTLAAWGLDVAGLMQVLPAGLFGQIQQAQQASAKAEGQGS